jgi:hypothetical protein
MNVEHYNEKFHVWYPVERRLREAIFNEII